MDPTANLQEQLELAAEFLAEEVRYPDQLEKAERLSELVLALHEWITKGGFLPEQWRTK